jgi:hypothetical protein
MADPPEFGEHPRIDRSGCEHSGGVGRDEPRQNGDEKFFEHGRRIQGTPDAKRDKGFEPLSL